MSRLLEYALYRSLTALVRILPRAAMVWLGRRLGMAYFLADARGRRTGMENLARALPERGDHRALLIESYRLQAVALLDAAWSTRLSVEDANRYVDVPKEIAKRINAPGREGKGIAVATAHFGSWEMFNLAGGAMRLPRATVIARPIRNALIDRHMKRMRERTGNRIVYRDEAIGACLSALRRGEAVCSVIDMAILPAEGGLFVDFLGTPASTSGALPMLALKRSAPLFFIVCRPIEKGARYVFEMSEIEAEPGDDREADLLRVTRNLNRALEEVVRAHPEAWIWSYKRWKYRPGEQPGPYPTYALWVHPHW
jgi:KDO2-lipid IV(A) lauroyltransferase